MPSGNRLLSKLIKTEKKLKQTRIFKVIYNFGSSEFQAPQPTKCQPEGSQVAFNFSTPNGKMGVMWFLTRPTSKVALTVKE